MRPRATITVYPSAPELVVIDERAVQHNPVWQAILGEVLHWHPHGCPIERLLARTGLYEGDLHWAMLQLRHALSFAAVDKTLPWLAVVDRAVHLADPDAPVTIRRLSGYPES